MGKTAPLSAVDSVSELIKDGNGLNDKDIDQTQVTEEVVVDDKIEVFEKFCCRIPVNKS